MLCVCLHILRLLYLGGIIERLRLEVITWFQPPAVGRAAPHQLRLPRAPSNLALKEGESLHTELKE